jgi:hypothetical protein
MILVEAGIDRRHLALAEGIVERRVIARAVMPRQAAVSRSLS